MRESFWGVMIVGLGITSMFLVYFFQSITNTSEHNYELLKETTEAAMYDSLDLAAYRYDGTVRIDRKFFKKICTNSNFITSISRNYIWCTWGTTKGKY